MIDDNGLLPYTAEDLSKQCQCSSMVIEKLIRLIKQCQPSGIGAYDIKECLLLQTDKLHHPLAYEILNSYLKELGERKYSYIIKKMHITSEQFNEAFDFIKTLNPKPAAFLGNEDIHTVRPEIIVSARNKNIGIELNNAALPKIVVSSQYRDLLSSTDEPTRKYLLKCLKKADWVVKCIDQRNATICRYSEYIVDRQQNFFIYGPGNLSPLSIDDMAMDLHVNKSTISRALSNKYLQCDWGVYPLNFFLSKRISSEQGDDVSNDSIKHALSYMIKTENRKKPLSDAEIAATLQKSGISISRRAIAKYRGELKIPNSAQRKEV